MPKKVVVSPSNPSNHGGPRTPLFLKEGTQRLLKVLIEQAGGPAKVTKRIKHPEIYIQRLLVWRREGKVPFKFVGLLSRKLNIPPLALNFEGITSLNADPVSWNAFVRSLPLSKKDRDWIFAGEAPKEYRGDD